MHVQTRYCAILTTLTGLALGLAPARHAEGQSISPELLSTFEYRSIGPTRQSGRFVQFAVPSQQPYTFYAATASGDSGSNGAGGEPPPADGAGSGDDKKKGDVIDAEFEESDSKEAQ